MEQLSIQPIETINHLSKEQFLSHYYKLQIPVVVKGAAKDWPAYNKWSFEYIKIQGKDKIVPLYDNSKVDASRKVNEPVASMPLAEYIDLLLAGDSTYRIFLYNLMKEIPQLKDDIVYPDLGVSLLRSMPMLFFAGAGSRVFMHYDIDLGNIYHYHFAGYKTALIAPPSARQYMYHVPFSTICLEDIDFENPDFEKYPALKKITFYHAELQHGDMLYMPEGWWHYMRYDTAGFSLALRSVPHKLPHLAEAVSNIFIVRHLDNLFRTAFGNRWIQFKNEYAYKRMAKWHNQTDILINQT